METQEFRAQLQQSILRSDIVRIFDNLLTIAVEEGASDIHIEPMENYSRIRLRIDGVLVELIQYPRSLHESIISKFKIESGQMRPDEKRLPQDARVSSITQTNKEIDLRANTLPTVWWEKLVMRIVDKSKSIPPLNQLWIIGSNKIAIEKHLKDPNGILLNTGPTGSGKTTTLYAALNEINTIERNIITYEDPVENKMSGLNQSQVRADIGYTFHSGLRSALRQDPDVIMVGEIRDKETLEMAMESAMTGHLVFSTIHTNSAVETLTRAFNLGAKPYMVAGTFNLIIAQRLCRKVCSHCAQKVKVLNDPQFLNAIETFKEFDREALKNEMISREITGQMWNDFIKEGIITVGTGKDPQTGGVCPVCGGSWYKGRVGLYELMDYTDDIKTMILDGKSAFEVGNYALQKGMIDLERDGIFKIIHGQTTFEELYRFVRMRNKK